MGNIVIADRSEFKRKTFSEGVDRTAAMDVLHQPGPFVTVLEVAANTTFPAHGHTVDQIIFVLEGGITNDRATEPLPPGSTLFLGKQNIYNTTVGPDGVAYFGIRPIAPDGADWDTSDIQHPTEGQDLGNRTTGLSARQIMELPADPVNGPSLTRRTIVDMLGRPKIGLMQAAADEPTTLTAATHTILAVFSGPLKLNDRVVKTHGIASIPPGTSYTASGDGSMATYLMVERMAE